MKWHNIPVVLLVLLVSCVSCATQKKTRLREDIATSSQANKKEISEKWITDSIWISPILLNFPSDSPLTRGRSSAARPPHPPGSLLSLSMARARPRLVVVRKRAEVVKQESESQQEVSIEQKSNQETSRKALPFWRVILAAIILGILTYLFWWFGRK